MSVRRKGTSLEPSSANNLKAQTNPRNEDLGVTVSQLTPVILDYYSVLLMVFGGCCANVWTYEQLLVMNSHIGSALTFSQMLFITTHSLPAFLHYVPNQRVPRLKPRQVPLSQWILQVFVLITGSLLNNWAFAYKVPLTLLIVFRSAGLAVSMLLGVFVLKKRYSLMQIISVVVVSAGVILATLSRPSSPSTPSSAAQSSADMQKYILGVTMLVVSLFCTGLLGLLQERTYRKYGPCWKEGVFYTHVLSLPIFLFFVTDIRQGVLSLSKSTSSSTVTSYLILAGNLITQLICVSGVNRLCSQVSSVSTNLVLTARKALSLCLSVWWFRSGWNAQLGVGAVMVFLGSILFTIDGEKNTKKE